MDDPGEIESRALLGSDMRSSLTVIGLLGLATLGGCAMQSSPKASMGAMANPGIRPARPDRYVTSLGAGDALGTAIHTSDVILAMKQEADAVSRITDAAPLEDAGRFSD